MTHVREINMTDKIRSVYLLLQRNVFLHYPKVKDQVPIEVD